MDRRILFLLLPMTALATTPRPCPADDAAKLEYFEKQVRPLLVNNCFNCHSADHKEAGGLRVDDHAAILKGGNRGAGVVPGDPDSSVLIRAVRQTDPKLKMPPDFKLTDEQIAILEQWIRDGAVWPKLEVPQDLGTWNADYEKLRREHWSWQPLTTPSLPPVTNESWVRNDIDRFVLSRLEKAGIAPVGDAGKLALLRRLTLDLTGLPPTPDEIIDFLADETPGAYEAVVDRLLASSAYGERWGRHWLDVARYGESTGSARNLPYPQAWRYRDWVIDAFNADKPYDRFIQEQIAGDLLTAATPAEHDANQVATGFLALGVKDVNQRFKVRFVMDNIDEQIDTVSRSVLGLTVSCARCHDHKFDPIPATDYYALAGIFHSTDLCAGLRSKMGGGGLDYYDSKLLLTLDSYPKPKETASPEEIEKAQALLTAAREEFERLRGTKEGQELTPEGRPKQQAARQKMNRAQVELNALTDPALRGAVALGVRDAATIGDTEMRLRGEAERLGPVVPRGYLAAVPVPGAPELNREQSGRLELARWLTDPSNPLASRVIVNRVWRHLFGQGLVKTVDNFGVTGDTPSHPELLDHLSQQLIRDGWSLKRLIRTAVLSRTYRLGSSKSEPALAVDPGNRLLWRHTPRRLEAEEIRDAALAATGALTWGRPEGSAVQSLKVIELRNNGPEAKQIVDAIKSSNRRSVYLPLVRTLVPTSLEVFDFAEQGMVTGSRDATTVPTQALYLLNDSFIRRRSVDFAERLLARNDLDDTGRLRTASLSLLGRLPTTEEIGRAQQFLSEYSAVADTLPPSDLGETDVAAAEPKEVVTEARLTKAPNPAANPDDVEQTDLTAADEVVAVATPRVAAWAAYLQSLLGSAEYRYVQ
jgi:hypothetical protein